MKLTLEYLKQRHEYWKYRLDLRDIWDHYKFKSVEIVLRKQSKFYDGMFCRTFIRSNTRLKMTSGINGCYYDRICIYQNKPEYTTREIDDTLVHEMIHQYISSIHISERFAGHKHTWQIVQGFYAKNQRGFSTRAENLHL